MTGNEFNAEYKIGQRIAAGSVETYLAHGTPTRRLVMVHRLAGAAEGERRRINSLVDALPTRSTTVLARVDVDGDPVLVTEFLPDFVTLREWLEAAVSVQTTIVIRTGTAPEPPRGATAAPSLERGGGDFTQLFGQASAPAAAPVTPSVPPPVAPPAPGAGSFTALFGAVPAAPAPSPAPMPPTPIAAPPVAASPASPPPASAPPRPGSFTELFGAALAPSDAAPLGPPRLTSSPPMAPSAPPSAHPNPPAGERAPRAPDSFTLMFGASSSPSRTDAFGAAPAAGGPAASEAPPGPPPFAIQQSAPSAPPHPAPAALPPEASPGDTPKIRVMWRPRGEPTPTSPVSASGVVKQPPPSPPPTAPAMAPPSAPSAPPMAPPAPTFGPPPFNAGGMPPAFNGPGATSPFAPGSFTPAPLAEARGQNAGSLGPPELRLFGGDSEQRAEPYSPPPVPSGPPPRASGPSDFTRMLTPVEPPPAAPAPPAVRPNAKAEPAGGGRRPSPLPLIIVVIVALVGAAALILYFALRK